MQNYKILILGPQCSGKTTLVRFLREKDNTLPLVEEDEMFVKLNNGKYPQDIEYKENILRPKLEEEIRYAENVIFVTSYCNKDLIRELKSRGFKIVQLVLDKDVLEERNKKRMKENREDDVMLWIPENLKFHQEIGDEGLVDKTIDVNKPIAEVAQRVLMK